MKSNILVTIIVSLFLFTASSAALAKGGDDKVKSAHAECPYFFKSSEEFDKKLEQLHQNLKLSAAQEPSWKDWAGKVKESREAWKKSKLDHDAWKNLTVIERLEKRLVLTRERLAHEETNLTAIKAFYAQLTDAQRKTFDEQFPHGYHCDKP
ncbi:Spy/CpxP family protein refolding chaperone [Candidatus Methylospira mobilis]|nr:Spy/CpxP family protein refolding chaperone [Candidatus Methylospira mobilis]WNV03942.1 Spy/CpxP family protein refolding chaperone [Candidatus Methylospira mobilis]